MNPVHPVRRDLQFRLEPAKVNTWHGGDVHVSTFFNTMSVFFPVGERFFIESVRNYRERITDPVLKQEVTGFIGQEAMHGREHEEYNRLMAQSGLPVEAEERRVKNMLRRAARFSPHTMQLGATIALEHLTAILADTVLRDPRVLEGADPRYAALWRWHALEETEHKAVAFDVYRTVMGSGVKAYLIRILSFLSANFFFWTHLFFFYLRNLHAQKQLFSGRGWWSILKFQWVTPGTFRRIIPAWFDYFRPGFHPWDHDNRAYLSQIEPLAREYEARLNA